MHASQLSGLLLSTAYALFALFAAATLIDAMPPALLDSGWIASTAATLVNFVSLPLLGLLCVHLAVYFTPTPRFQSIQARTARWAAIAALGFLLLVPLLGALVIQNGQTTDRNNTRARLRVNEQTDQLRRAVNQARTTAELQASMVALKGPTLDSAAMSQPLPVLQKQLIATVETARSRYLAQLPEPYSRPYWPVLKIVLRTAIQSILASLALAALSWSSNSNTTLLQRLLKRAASVDPRRPSPLEPLRRLIAKAKARLALNSRMNQLRSADEKKKRERQEAKRRIRQETQERKKQTRLYLQNLAKKRRKPEQDSDNDL